MVQLRVLVLCIVVLDTDRGPGEVLQVVLKFDEEYAVITVYEANLLLESWCPELRLVGPVPLPLSTAPGIPELEQLDFFALMLELVDRYERVGVAGDDSFSVTILTLSMAGGHHRKVPLVSRLKHVKELFKIFNCVMLMTLRWNSHNVRSCKAWQATLCPCVSSMELGPGLLEETNPDFAVPARCKARLAIGTHRKMIIDNNGSLLTVQVENDHVDSSLVNLLSQEHLLDAIGKLGQRAQSGQEVAVTELTLVDVVGFNAVLENVDWVEDLAGALPFERVERPRVNVSIDGWVVKR